MSDQAALDTRRSPDARRGEENVPRTALVNLISQTSLVRSKAPAVVSNKDAMIVAFARALKKNGLPTDLFMADAYKPRVDEDLAINVQFLPTRWKRLFWPSCIPFTPGLIDRLKNNYDIVICSEIFQMATLLAVLAKIFSKKGFKIVIWQELAKHQRLGGQFISWFYHAVVLRYFVDAQIDLYIPRGELARQFLINQRISPEKITNVVSHGIDPEKFYYDQKIIKERYIFSPSRLVHCKGIDVLLKAFAIVQKEIADLKLVIQGDGPLLVESQQLANSLGIGSKVDFNTKRIGHQEMCQYYQKALLTVIASRADNIIFSDMESMACGTPIVISDGADSHKNVIDGQGGLVVPQGDPQALARALLRSLSDENYRKEMETAALRKAEGMTNDSLARSFINHLRHEEYL